MTLPYLASDMECKVLNFFPDPVWAAICLTDDPATLFASTGLGL